MERIFVVKADKIREFFKEHNIQEGYIKNIHAHAIYNHIQNKKIVMNRDDVEHDKRYLQIIPYITIVTSDGENLLYLAYSRSKASGESRLHSKYSLGFGGHMDEEDGCIHKCIERELQEELSISKIEPIRLQYAGIIYTTETDVSSVHIGLHYFYTVSYDQIIVPSREIDEIKLLTLEEIDDYSDKLESWSSIIYEVLKERQPLLRL